MYSVSVVGSDLSAWIQRGIGMSTSWRPLIHNQASIPRYGIQSGASKRRALCELPDVAEPWRSINRRFSLAEMAQSYGCECANGLLQWSSVVAGAPLARTAAISAPNKGPNLNIRPPHPETMIERS